MSDTRKCHRCGHHGAEISMKRCQCEFHTRCFPISQLVQRTRNAVSPCDGNDFTCTSCGRSDVSSIYLIPLDMKEIELCAIVDDGNGQTSSNSSITSEETKETLFAEVASILSFSSSVDSAQGSVEEVYLRNGRWTNEETVFVDQVINQFERGSLALPRGLTLNDFLRSILLCKSTRLRKKIKNANFCTKTYELNLSSSESFDVDKFSAAFEGFLSSVESEKERRLLRFIMRTVWSSHFLDFCVQIGFDLLDAGDWLSSLEAIERRSAAAKELLKQRVRRKRLSAVFQEVQEVPRPWEVTDVVLESSKSTSDAVGEPVSLSSVRERNNEAQVTDTQVSTAVKSCDGAFILGTSSGFSGLTSEDDKCTCQRLKRPRDEDEQGLVSKVDDVCHKLADWSPFVERIADYVQKEKLPFEYIDVWVAENGSPCDKDSENGLKLESKEISQYGQSVYLRHVGHAVRADIDSIMTMYHMNEFGRYSSRFVFPPGVGLPGRVFISGQPLLDNFLQVAQNHNFPRVIGARTHGIEAGLGIPVPSSSGRVILALYSIEKIHRYSELIQHICRDLQDYHPVSSWRLLVDARPFTKKDRTSSISSDRAVFDTYDQYDPEDEAMMNLIGCFMCHENSSNLCSDIRSSAAALRLLLLKNPRHRSLKEISIIDILKKSYRSFMTCDPKTEFDRAMLLVNDWIYLKAESEMLLNPISPLKSDSKSLTGLSFRIVDEDDSVTVETLSQFGSSCHVASDGSHTLNTELSEDEEIIIISEHISSCHEDISSSELFDLIADCT